MPDTTPVKSANPTHELTEFQFQRNGVVPENSHRTGIAAYMHAVIPMLLSKNRAKPRSLTLLQTSLWTAFITAND